MLHVGIDGFQYRTYGCNRALQDGMGSQPSDQQYFPDFGKKGSQNGLIPKESPKHRLKCQNAGLGWVSEVFMPRFIPQLHLSAEIQDFPVSNPSKPVFRQSWDLGCATT